MKLILLFMLLLLLSILLTPLFISHFQMNLSEPEFKSYVSDEVSFTKTFYLMENGQNYYSAYKAARENFSSGVRFNNEVATFRFPTIFFLWSLLLNNAEQILTAFIFLTGLMLGCVYLMMRKFLGSVWAIGAAAMLLPYVVDTLFYKTGWLFIEWWGLFFFIFGVTAIFYNKVKWAIIFFCLALIIRELFIIPILLMLVFSVLNKQDRKVFYIPIFVVSLFYLWHWWSIEQLLKVSDSTTVVSRIHQFSWPNLQRMLAFSMRQYVVAGLKTHYLLIGLGILGTVINLIVEKNKNAWYFLLSWLGFMIVLPMISILDNDYWGIIFVPLVLMASLLIIKVREIK